MSTLFNKSSFLVDEVTANAAGGGNSAFLNSFFVVLHDPPEPPLAQNTSSIFADPSHTAVSGIFADNAIAPQAAVVDETGTEMPCASSSSAVDFESILGGALVVACRCESFENGPRRMAAPACVIHA